MLLNHPPQGILPFTELLLSLLMLWSSMNYSFSSLALLIIIPIRPGNRLSRTFKALKRTVRIQSFRKVFKMYTNPLKGADQLTISVHSSSQHLNPPQHAYLNKRNMFFSVTRNTNLEQLKKWYWLHQFGDHDLKIETLISLKFKLT